MLYFDIDPRDGGPVGAACSACCCQTFSLRPGETNLLRINYAPWSLPIGYPGIVPTLGYSIEKDDSGCSSDPLGGFTPPLNSNYQLTTPQDNPLPIDLSVGVFPISNTFTYRIIPLNGPNYGTVTQTGLANGPTFMYEPAASYTGYDYFSYETMDAQGRKIQRTVQISVGNHFDQPEPWRLAMEPFIDVSKIVTDQRYQTVTIPIHMPLAVLDCESFRLTIKQPARDCNRTVFHHIACFDVIPKDCS